MSSLLEKYSADIKESSAVVETIRVEITRVIPYKDTRKLILDTNKGRFFVWKDSIRGIKNTDALPHKFQAEITLTQKGEYVNVTEVMPDLESLGKYNFVSSNRLAVAL